MSSSAFRSGVSDHLVQVEDGFRAAFAVLERAVDGGGRLEDLRAVSDLTSSVACRNSSSVACRILRLRLVALFVSPLSYPSSVLCRTLRLFLVGSLVSCLSYPLSKVGL